MKGNTDQMEEEKKEYRPTVAFDAEGAPEPLSLANAVCHVLDRRSAEEVELLPVGKEAGLADYFVICTAKSTTHLRALADEVEFRLGLSGIDALRREGRGDGQSWNVIDYGDVIVHIFTAEARRFYDLDRLVPEPGRIEIAPDTDGEEEENK